MRNENCYVRRGACYTLVGFGGRPRAVPSSGLPVTRVWGFNLGELLIWVWAMGNIRTPPEISRVFLKIDERKLRKLFSETWVIFLRRIAGVAMVTGLTGNWKYPRPPSATGA